MAQRLVFKSETIKDVVKTFDTMYVADKLYDYANYITLYGAHGALFFEMCVILDGASNDAMVRLWEPVEGQIDFNKVVINFEELKSIVKAIRSDEVVFEIDGHNITILSGKSSHLAKASTVGIPAQITSVLDDFFKNEQNLVDFNLVKLYNNMNDLGENLTVNTLRADLYGIMNDPRFLVSTDGFSIRMNTDGQLPVQFMFPKHSLRILKTLPKLGAKYAVVNHRLYIKGAGFECYIGEWSGYKTYPLEALAKYKDVELTPVVEPNEALQAIRRCHLFDDVAIVYFGLGYATNKDKTHKEVFEPTPELGDKEMILHRSVLVKLEETDMMSVDPDKALGKVVDGTRTHIFMGMREK